MTRTRSFQHLRRHPVTTVTVACLLLAACLAAFRPSIAAAQETTRGSGHPAPGGAPGDAAETLAEGLEKLHEGIAKLLEEIPRYAPPEVTENGDIILRRLDPPARERRAPAPERRAPPIPHGDGGTIRL
ncbi:MAG TPA: hypothetical protein VK943_09450 [Arenibaculum sp.]|nr:hypothetical protein [Arenibaculum sp.]